MSASGLSEASGRLDSASNQTVRILVEAADASTTGGVIPGEITSLAHLTRAGYATSVHPGQGCGRKSRRESAEADAGHRHDRPLFLARDVATFIVYHSTTSALVIVASLPST
jgi:hypothetical protein